MRPHYRKHRPKQDSSRSSHDSPRSSEDRDSSRGPRSDKPRGSGAPQREARYERKPRPGSEREYPREAKSDESRNYVVGRRAALELLHDEESREKIEKIYLVHGVQGPQIAELLHTARKNKITLGELDRIKFRELERRAAGGTDTQGVIVLISQRSYQELEDILRENARPLLIALDGVEDPHNIGAIIRSAEACGASAILLPRRGAVLTPAVYKTSAGAASHLPIVKYGNLEQTIRRLQEEFGVVCYGLAGEAEDSIFETDLTGPICLVTGSEEKGLHRLVRERCEKLVKIPLTGKTASLNASVASAVALFEVVRQRASARD